MKASFSFGLFSTLAGKWNGTLGKGLSVGQGLALMLTLQTVRELVDKSGTVVTKIDIDLDGWLAKSGGESESMLS
jgi:hypothetical protein